MTRSHRIPDNINNLISSFVINQLQDWDLCKKNYSALESVERRELPVGDFPSALQFNPGRVKSTSAKVDSKSIENRPCFLCVENRPKQQLSETLDADFEILLNPYPIFPLHFTVVSTSHIAQSHWPLQMIPFVEKLRGVCAFYNGAKAGASAPDHLHFQGVADCELPIVELVERCHDSDSDGMMKSTDFGLDLPFGFWSWVISPGLEGMQGIAEAMRCKGYDRSKVSGSPESSPFVRDAATKDLINVFVWIDGKGKLRIVVIPRSAHRPECYYADGPAQHTVSPGAVDMAGLIILPDEKDFETISSADLKQIYSETALSPNEFNYLADFLMK